MSTDRTDIRSRALDLLRFPLAIVIVIVHVFVPIELYGYDYDFGGILGFAIAFVKSFLTEQSVPIYFFISGYVFFLGFDLSMKSYAKKMRNRFKSLFIPYILWNTLAIILMLLPFVPFLSGFFPRFDHNSPLDLSIPTILRMYWECGWSSIRPADVINYSVYPADVPLWFVRDLMIVAITTPLLNIMLRRFGAWIPVILGVIWFLVDRNSFPRFFQIASAYFFFSWGAYMSFNKKDMITEFKRYRNLSFVIYPMMGAVLMVSIYALRLNIRDIYENGFPIALYYTKNCAVLAGLPFAYNIAVILIERFDFRIARNLTSASFFIYAGHAPLIVYTERIATFIVRPETEIQALIFFFVSTALIVGLLLGTFVVMKKVCPSILKPFVGGRL